MAEVKLTKAKIKRFADAVIESNKRYPKNSINNLIEVQYKDCDIQNRTIEYKTIISEAAINRIGTAHGGYLAGVMDDCMGMCLHAFLFGTHHNATTLDMRFNCLKMLVAGDKIVIKCQVEHIGKRTAVTTSEIWRGREKCAISTESWAMIDNFGVDTMVRYNME